MASGILPLCVSDNGIVKFGKKKRESGTSRRAPNVEKQRPKIVKKIVFMIQIRVYGAHANVSVHHTLMSICMRRGDYEIEFFFCVFTLFLITKQRNEREKKKEFFR